MNNTILITGNRKGIGRSLTEYFLAKGKNVIGCSRTQSDLTHENYVHFECDVANESEVINVVRLGKKKFGSIDVLINNAGIASMNHSLLTPGSTVDKVFQTNFNGSFFFSRECAKVMIKNSYGRIVNFSTIAVPLDLEGELVYAASKSAVEKMTQILAKELSSYHITVNAIGPTPIETDLIKVVPRDKVQEILNKQTIKRFGTFEDVINVVNFFICEESEFITGQTIYLGGL